MDSLSPDILDVIFEFAICRPLDIPDLLTVSRRWKNHLVYRHPYRQLWIRTDKPNRHLDVLEKLGYIWKDLGRFPVVNLTVPWINGFVQTLETCQRLGKNNMLRSIEKVKFNNWGRVGLVLPDNWSILLTELFHGDTGRLSEIEFNYSRISYGLVEGLGPLLANQLSSIRLKSCTSPKSDLISYLGQSFRNLSSLCVERYRRTLSIDFSRFSHLTKLRIVGCRVGDDFNLSPLSELRELTLSHLKFHVHPPRYLDLRNMDMLESCTLIDLPLDKIRWSRWAASTLTNLVLVGFEGTTEDSMSDLVSGEVWGNAKRNHW